MNLGTHISVGYLFSTVDDTAANRISRIEEVMSQVFPSRFTQVSNSKDEFTNEVIYSIQCPIFEGKNQEVLLFKDLQTLFTDTSDLSPYFCNYKEEN